MLWSEFGVKMYCFVGLQVYASQTAVWSQHSWWLGCTIIWKEYWIGFRYFIISLSLICTENLPFLTTLLLTHLCICRGFWGRSHKLYLLLVKNSFGQEVTIYTTKYLSIQLKLNLLNSWNEIADWLNCTDFIRLTVHDVVDYTHQHFKTENTVNKTLDDWGSHTSRL